MCNTHQVSQAASDALIRRLRRAHLRRCQDDMTLSLRGRSTAVALLAATATTAALLLTAAPSQAADTTTASGTINGAAWTAKVPANWNHTLLLWNHGIRPTVDPRRNPEWAPKATDGDTTDALLAKGYALVGSAYR